MKNIQVSAHAVLFNGDDVLLLRRSKTDTRRPLEWDLPGGIVDDSELLNEACAREVEEESGIKIEPLQLHLAYSESATFEEVGGVTWLIFVGNSNTRDVTLSYEHDEYEWVNLSQALEMVEYKVQLNALKHIYDNQIFSVR